MALHGAGPGILRSGDTTLNCFDPGPSQAVAIPAGDADNLKEN
jgi:hypothetical protein